MGRLIYKLYYCKTSKYIKCLLNSKIKCFTLHNNIYLIEQFCITNITFLHVKDRMKSDPTFRNYFKFLNIFKNNNFFLIACSPHHFLIILITVFNIK